MLAPDPGTAYIGPMVNIDPVPQNAAPGPEPARKISFVSLGCPKALVDSERIITRLRAEGYELARNHAAPGPEPARKISFVSLGCPKALVDSERIITRLRAEGYELARNHDGADLVIVNTCGFLDSAQAESLSAIGSALRDNGKVIVTGCMGAEPEKITARFPNVLAVTGPQQYESVLDAVHRAAPPHHHPFVDLVPPEGVKLTPRHYAYLKISEGCNNRCSFCIIPRLRGDLVSRPAADVLREAERLVGSSISPRRWANWASGCACTMSIPIRMSTPSSR